MSIITHSVDVAITTLEAMTRGSPEARDLKARIITECLEIVRRGKNGLCALCSGPGDLLSFYLPVNDAMSRRLGSRRGEYRIVGYFLCYACADRPDKAARVEAALLRDLEVQ